MGAAFERAPRSTAERGSRYPARKGVRMAQHLLSKADNNRIVDVQNGDVLVIDLPELATAGYSWQAEQVPDGLDVAFRPLPSVSDAAGATARTQVVATVRVASHGDLVLRHRQRWSPEDDDEAFRVTIRVNR